MSLRRLFVCCKCNTIHVCSQMTPRLPSFEVGFKIITSGNATEVTLFTSSLASLGYLFASVPCELGRALFSQIRSPR